MTLQDEIDALARIASHNATLTFYTMRLLLTRVRTAEGDALADARSELAERYAAQLRHKAASAEYSRGAGHHAKGDRKRAHAADLLRRRLTLLAPCYTVIAAGHARRCGAREVSCEVQP